jgi:hypothetical protein
MVSQRACNAYLLANAGTGYLCTSCIKKCSVAYFNPLQRVFCKVEENISYSYQLNKV